MEEMQASQQIIGIVPPVVAAMSHHHHDRDPYLVKSVVHASQILSAFHNGVEVLPLKDIVARCGLPKSMVFRLLYTMAACHIVEKVGGNRYHLVVRQPDDLPAPAETPKKRRVSGVRRVSAIDAAQNVLSSG